MEAVMTLRDVSASYEGKPALEDISLDIPAGQITAIIGPSGCGKSTLLRCMNGMLEEEPGARWTGEIALHGTSTRRMPREELRRRVGLVFQTPSPFPFSIYRNLTYAPRYYGQRSRPALDALVREKLELTGLYEEVRGELHKSALKLSGGQQQRLCIARALTVEPELLLLDEPCSALDVKSSAVIENLLIGLKERYSMVVVTHNIAQARRIADRVVFLYNGRLVEEGAASTVLSRPAKPETAEFLSGTFG